MGTVPRSTLTDDSGGGTDGSILNNSEIQKLYDNIDAEAKSANYATITTKSIIDNALAGLPHVFGGSVNVGRIDTSYPVGATADKLAPNTGFWAVDSALLAVGTYKLEAMLAVDNAAATVTLALVNLTDASETAMVTITSTSTTGQKVQSGAITFPAAGVSKTYGVKLITSNASYYAYAWQIRLFRSA